MPIPKVLFTMLTLAVLSLGACSSDPEPMSDPVPVDDPKPEVPIDKLRPPMGWWTESKSALREAQEMVAEMSLGQKVNMMHGELNPFYGFYNAPISELGIPALRMADGPVGVRIGVPEVNGQRATLLPSGLAVGATWDPALARLHGSILGEEAYATDHNVMLGPTVDIVRTPLFGRAFETYGEDPLLNGVLGAASIRGIQSHPVISTLKHYTAYTQEKFRLNGGNVVIDERALQEIYVRPFTIANRDGRPGSVMCAFNKLNGVYACSNEYLIDDVLKGQLGFEGWVMTDYGGVYSTAKAVLAGTDQEMPGNVTPDVGPGECLFCGPLIDAVEAGVVPTRRIDDAVTRILFPMFGLGLFDKPPSVKPFPEREHGADSRRIAERSIVLLKNDASALPLDKSAVSSIAVIGADADVVVYGGGSARVIPTYTVSPLAGIRARVGSDVEVVHVPGTDPVISATLLPGPDPVPSGFLTPPDGTGDGLLARYWLNPNFEGEPELDRVDPYAAIAGGLLLFEGFGAASPHFPEQPGSLNTSISVRWSGQLRAPVTGTYQLALTTSGTARLYLDGALVLEARPAELDTMMVPVELEGGSMHDVRVEFGSLGADGVMSPRNTGPQFKFGWIPPEGVVAPKIQAAAELARNSDVAVVFVRDYGSEAEDLPDLILPVGQAQLIKEVAAANPRTIVVLTVGGAIRTKNWEADVPAILHAWYGGQEQGNAIARVLFGEVNPSGRLPITLPVEEGLTPVSDRSQYPGVNLDATYSEGIFVGYRGYNELNITPQYAFGHGLSYTSFEYGDLQIESVPARDAEGRTFQVSLSVRNTGDVAGLETVQVYVGVLPSPMVSAPKALAGWTQVALQPGERKSVMVGLSRESHSYWDVDQDRWQTPGGQFPIFVGRSSADIRLEGTGTLEEPYPK